MLEKYRHFAEKITDIYIIIMLLIFPLFVSLNGYADITITKYLFFVISTLSKPQKPKIHVVLALFFAIFSIISALLSEFTIQTIIGASRYGGLITILLQVGIFIGVSSFGKFSYKYLNCLAFSTAICCIVAIFQLNGSTFLFPNDYNYYDGGVLYVGKFLGTIGNTNILAAFLCTSATLLTASFVLLKRNICYLISSALAIFILIASESEGGVVAVCVALAFGVLLWAKQKIPKKYHIKCIVFALILVILIILIVIFIIAPTEGVVYEIIQILQGNVNTSFGSSRILIWQEALKLFPEKPFFGGGPDTLVLRLDIDFSRYSEELGSELQSYVDNPHNVYIAYLVNLGILALIAYLCMILFTLKHVLKSQNRQILAIGIALISFWTEEFFGLGLPIVSPIMWLIWGLVFTSPQKI